MEGSASLNLISGSIITNGKRQTRRSRTSETQGAAIPSEDMGNMYQFLVYIMQAGVVTAIGGANSVA